MGVNIGGAIPDFKFRLNPTVITSQVLVSGGVSTVTGQSIDSQFSTVTNSNTVAGSRYNIQVVTENFNFIGNDVVPSLSVDNTGIASLDGSNNTQFISTGYFNVMGTYPVDSSYYGQNVKFPLLNTSGGGESVVVTTYTPDTVNVYNHILIVYNSGSTDSIAVKNYYTGVRPLFSGANILGLTGCATGESISYTGFTQRIRQPIINWLTGNSGVKPIRYIVMMYDIPTRVSDTIRYSVPYQLNRSFQSLGLRNGTSYAGYNKHFSLNEFKGDTCLVSYINFGTTGDCKGYIDKISNGQTGIYLSGNGNNTGYYIEDVGGAYTNTWPTFCSGRYLTPILNEFPSAPYFYKAFNSSFITTGNGLAGFCTWGANGGRGGNYANNGAINWGGSNNFYIMTTIESNNGMRNIGQGNFIDWFSSGAFGGGTGYSNIPVGAVTHNEEPGLFGVANTGLFLLWQRGWPFIECAWQSRATPYSLVLGDPLVIK